MQDLLVKMVYNNWRLLTRNFIYPGKIPRIKIAATQRQLNAQFEISVENSENSEVAGGGAAGRGFYNFINVGLQL